MAVHKTSKHAQHTIQHSNPAGLKMDPLHSDGLFEDKRSDIGNLALQLLLELDLMTPGTSPVTKLDDISGSEGIRAKLLNLFERHNMVEIDGAGPKITTTGQRSLHTILSTQTLGREMLTNRAAMPSGCDATSILLAIMRDHFALRSAVI